MPDLCHTLDLFPMGYWISNLKRIYYFYSILKRIFNEQNKNLFVRLALLVCNDLNGLIYFMLCRLLYNAQDMLSIDLEDTSWDTKVFFRYEYLGYYSILKPLSIYNLFQL